MHLVHRAGRVAAMVGLAVVVTGCANLDGVRAFAASAARMTDYRDATDRYFDSTDRLLAEMPATADFDAPRVQLEAQKREQAGQKAALLTLHATATGYLTALARLAGDDTYDLSGAIDRIDGKLVAIPGVVDADQLAAYARITRAVSSWVTAAMQAHDVKTLARAHGDAIDTLLAALQAATALYETALRNERAAIRSFEDAREVAWRLPIGTEADRDAFADRREAVVAWGRRSYVPVEREETDAIAQAHRAGLGIAKVRDGHAAMLQNLDQLDRKELVALLKRTAADLQAIRASLVRI